jgi:hypothetical protein
MLVLQFFQSFGSGKINLNRSDLPTVDGNFGIELNSPAGRLSTLIDSSAAILRHHWHSSFDVGAAFVEDLGFCGFGGFAVGFGHRFGVADDHAGGAAEDFADGPGVVVVGEEDFADALFFGAVVPAAEEGEVVAEEGEVVGLVGFFFEGFEGVGGAVFG